jgi:hypothetical protein
VPSFATATIPCALTRLRILPVTTGVYYPQCPSDLGLHQSGDLPLCLHSPSRAVDAQPGFQ